MARQSAWERSLCDDYLTISVPCIDGWYVHGRRIRPVRSAQSACLSLPSTSTVNLPAVSDVTECSTESVVLDLELCTGRHRDCIAVAHVRIVMVAAAGALVASLPLAVAVAVPVGDCGLVLLEPPHAVATAAMRPKAAQNNPILFS